MDTKDIAFLKAMIIHHENAIKMAKKILETTKDSNVKGLANAVVKAQTGEIDKMKKWLSDAGESASGSSGGSHDMKMNGWGGVFAP